MTATPISVQDYLTSKVQKGNKQNTDDKLSEPVDIFDRIHNDEKLNKMETDRQDREPKMIQLTENMVTVQNERPTIHSK